MRPHPAARPSTAPASGMLGGLRRRARTAAYGTATGRLLPRIALGTDTRRPTVVLGAGEVRAEITDTWSLIGWDPVRVVVGLDPDDPLTVALSPGAEAVLGVAPGTRSGPRWRGHATATDPLGLLLLKVEGTWEAAGRVVHLLRATDAESHLLRSRQAWARRSRGGAADPIESVAWTVPRPIGLVTTAQGEDEHIFPADLCGSLGGGVFAMGLGPGSASLAAIEDSRQFTWSTVDASAGRSAHDLRIGHRRRTPGALSADVRHFKRSPELDLPLPMWALRASELSLVEVRRGDRAVVLARVIKTTRIRNAEVLAHLHRDALAWRQAAGWATKVLGD
ncbi:MAG: hypothetical protein VX265_08205 [Myxococcota bacterium]|nr:hypothetical protein [Myxococcota bacterium]